MVRSRTIDDALSATLEHIEEVLRVGVRYVPDHAVAEERFADAAASQLLTLIPAELRARSAWSGYGGTAVARRLLDAFDTNWNRWEPTAALAVADAALAIARTSDRCMPALLFRACKQQANALRTLCRFSEAFRWLDEAEEYALDTNCPRLHRAILANTRAAVFLNMDRWREASLLASEARDGYAACGDSSRLNELRTFEGGMLFATGRYDEARELFQAVIDDPVTSGDAGLLAIEVGNIGLCLTEVGDIASARHYLRRAAAMYSSLGWECHRAEMVATLGKLTIRERGTDAIPILEEVCAEFKRLGVLRDWAETRVEMAAELLAVDPSCDVSLFCREGYATALSLGMTALAERALGLLERDSQRGSPQ